MHDLKKESSPGHGSWLFCKNCGCTKHSGFWWFTGMKSKREPPCDDDRAGQREWLKNATNDTHDGFDGGGACGAHD